MARDTREEEAIQAVVERLTDAYVTTHTPKEVEAAVTEAHASFRDRPVRDFVPVLVERRARAALDREASARW
ncbi:three-helix bundle dimerization domain-containing protein [Streptomyces lydicus]|uniref:three-helix bundle dimerization domain-containing protein n=1 Tax=Streptomyces lydicus TaxID=47763 RepID=UPI003673C67B